MQGAEHEVARLGRGERDGNGLEIAHLADEDDVRVLAQRMLQGIAERQGVVADLALVHHAEAVPVHELDRVLNRHDVGLARAIRLVDDRRQGCGLTGAGRTGDKYEAAREVSEVTEVLRHVQRLKRLDLPRNGAEHSPDRAALLKEVHAESRGSRQLVGEVEFL
ncbi:unannotated protein [freshwater metagenome]|uniref:Unannotated protein n=1 Tax=freshwater metagenome TaxID=449393 RepID=A0A6J7I3P0_9ZZZZ